MPIAKGEKYPRQACSTCGLDVVFTKDRKHPRDHQCPHEHRCRPPEQTVDTHASAYQQQAERERSAAQRVEERVDRRRDGRCRTVECEPDDAGDDERVSREREEDVPPVGALWRREMRQHPDQFH